MFCARCGQQIPDATEICPLCGREATIPLPPQSGVVQAAAPAPAPVREPVQERPFNPKLKGVGGWLLFFCIAVTILSPLAVIGVFLTSQITADLFNLSIMAIIAIAIFSVVTGLAVWTGSSRAVPVLKAYFLILGGYALFNLTFVLTSGLEEGGASRIVAHVRTLIFVAIWASYFHRSERVRATFGRNL